VDAFTSQESHCRYAVGGDVQVDTRSGLAEGFLCQPDIAGTVFDQENFQGRS
jgi:hypothetical protein